MFPCMRVIALHCISEGLVTSTIESLLPRRPWLDIFFVTGMTVEHSECLTAMLLSPMSRC